MSRRGPIGAYNGRIQSRIGPGEQCENGGRLVSFADFDRPVDPSTQLQHPHGHLLTGYSNDSWTVHQIDFILVPSHRSSPIDVRQRCSSGITKERKRHEPHTICACLRPHLYARRKIQRHHRVGVPKLTYPESV